MKDEIGYFQRWLAVIAKHHKKIKFVIIGACCFLINSLFLFVLTKLKLSVALAQVIGYEMGLLFGFYANSRWTYKKNKRGSFTSSLLKYHGASLSALILSTVIVVLLNKQAGLSPNIALIFASGAAMVWNYFLFDKFVFNNKSTIKTADNDRVDLLKKVLLIYLVWELVMMGVGMWASGLQTIKHPPTLPFDTPYVLDHTYRWDAEWYNGIASDNWYKTHPQAPAFYPLFPLAIRTASHLFGGNLVTTAFILNAIATALAFCFLALIAFEVTKSKRLSLWVVLLFSAFPTAFFLQTMYSEALFCMLGFAAFYYALRRKWVLCCTLLAFTTAVRFPGVLFVLACFVEYCRSIDYDYKKVRFDILLFLITPLGLLAYAYYLNRLYHSPLYMFEAYHVAGSWSYHRFNIDILANIYQTARGGLSVLKHRSQGWLFYALWQLPSLIIWSGGMLAIIYGRLKQYISVPMVVLALGSGLLFVLDNNFVSVSRYLLPIFPLYIVMAKVIERKRYTLVPFLALSGFIELWFLVLFVRNYFIA